MDWRVLYPGVANPVVRFLDVGCGFGGLTGACLPACVRACIGRVGHTGSLDGLRCAPSFLTGSMHASTHTPMYTVALSGLYPDKVVLALEIREKVRLCGGALQWCPTRTQAITLLVRCVRVCRLLLE